MHYSNYSIGNLFGSSQTSQSVNSHSQSQLKKEKKKELCTYISKVDQRAHQRAIGVGELEANVVGVGVGADHLAEDLAAAVAYVDGQARLRG